MCDLLVDLNLYVWIICYYDCAPKPWTNGVASRRKLKTWIYLRLRSARACVHLRSLWSIKFARKPKRAFHRLATQPKSTPVEWRPLPYYHPCSFMVYYYLFGVKFARGQNNRWLSSFNSHLTNSLDNLQSRWCLFALESSGFRDPEISTKQVLTCLWSVFLCTWQHSSWWSHTCGRRTSCIAVPASKDCGFGQYLPVLVQKPRCKCTSHVLDLEEIQGQAYKRTYSKTTYFFCEYLARLSTENWWEIFYQCKARWPSYTGYH